VRNRGGTTLRSRALTAARLDVAERDRSAAMSSIAITKGYLLLE